jgi:hypothetical protein
MKTFKFYTVICIVSFLPLTVFANIWNKPDKGYFKYQKDLDKTVSDYSQSMFTIYFHGKLFNFIDYQVMGLDSSDKVIIRKLALSADKSTWSMVKQDEIKNLSGLNTNYWQPSPVVFHDSLYLFVDNGLLSYSLYNEKSDSWSSLKEMPRKYPDFNSAPQLTFGAAVVVDDKLCVISSKWGSYGIHLFWTKDLVSWNHHDTKLVTGLDFAGSIGEAMYYGNGSQLGPLHLSAISKSWIDKTGQINSKIMLAYLTDDGKSVKIAELAFDDQDTIQLLSDETVASEFNYSFVSLADGAVKGDLTTNSTTQLFLKKREKDNWYLRYRILRYQKEEGGSWSKRENNLVPQNYLWADKKLDINAVNFTCDDGKQLMCLVYRGYDDWDHPLNIAWAENDQVPVGGTQPILAATTSVSGSSNGITDDPLFQKTQSGAPSLTPSLPRLQNWPNPFTATTTIRYRVGEENQEISDGTQQYTQLSAYDNRGNLVAILVNERKDSGTYDINWDATLLPPGIYFCRLQTGNQSAVCKLVLN